MRTQHADRRRDDADVTIEDLPPRAAVRGGAGRVPLGAEAWRRVAGPDALIRSRDDEDLELL
jgi:hypothetical protein